MKKNNTLHARTSDPQTSHKSAALASKQFYSVADSILEALKTRATGLTTHELANITGRSLVSVSPLMRPLVRKELIYNSGKRRVNVASGHSAIVWKIGKAPAGAGDNVPQYTSKKELLNKIFMLEHQIRKLTGNF